MYDKAKYYSNKFIRNGIAGLVFTAIVISIWLDDSQPHPVGLIAFPITTVLWFYFGFRLKKKLKTKEPVKFEITDRKISFKVVERIFMVLLAATIFLATRKEEYSSPLMISALVLYFSWFAWQMTLLNKYFKTT